MAESRPPGGTRRVLVVDADPSFSQSLEEEFKARAFEVETTASLDDAISRTAAAPPDLVVLDLYLPDGAAFSLLRRWKSEAPGLVIVLVSMSASLTVVVEALKAGASGFFLKPVSPAILLDEFEARQGALSSPGPPNHLLGRAALRADGVDRFFAISPGLMSVAGFDGYFKLLNPAWEQTLGYSIDELCAQPYLELVHPDDRAKARDEALEVSAGQAVFRFKNRYRCKDGSYRWLAWSATPSPAEGLIYGAAQDVTAKVRMEEGLRHSNDRLKERVADREHLLRDSAVRNDTLVQLGRFKDETSAMIVHDLKNSLSVVLSNYQFVLEGFEGADDCREALQDSQNAGQRMLRLLANLIDVGRLEDGVLVARPLALVLSPLLQSIVEQRRGVARTKKIAMHVSVPPELMVKADRDLLTRSIENVLDNALQHTPDGGRIQIDVRGDGAEAEIRIGNSGDAVALEARQKIFDKYEQVGSERERSNLGLGLYFCRLAMAAQGSRIWVEETESLPAVFMIRLPRWVEGRVPAGACVSRQFCSLRSAVPALRRRTLLSSIWYCAKIRRCCCTNS